MRSLTIGPDRGWCDNLHLFLDRLDAERVILCLDDFLLIRRVDSETVDRMVGIAIDRGLGCLRLRPAPPPSKPVRGESNLGVVLPGEPYRVSTQIAIWDPQFLRRLARPGFNIWEFEHKGTLLADRLPRAIWAVYEPVIDYRHGIERGLWLEEGLEICRDAAIVPDLSARHIMTPEQLVRRSRHPPHLIERRLVSILPPAVCTGPKALPATRTSCVKCQPMTFDVAITSYKRSSMTTAAVMSCLDQGPLLQRVVVVDDASGDNTAESLHSIDDSRIVVLERAENGGIAAARRAAFALSDADWTVSLDSDHELLPGAIAGLARLLASAPQPVDILGARYQWDTGGVTPVNIPDGIVEYRERIILSGQKDSIGADYLCAISKRLRQAVKWEPLRGSFPDTLFQLDIAKSGRAIFTPEALALERSDGAHGWTRAVAEQRWVRRCQDAPDGIKALELILSRHGPGLRRWGKAKLAGLYVHGAFAALLSGQRAQALRWLADSIQAGGLSVPLLGLTLCSTLPRRMLKRIYLLRG